MRRSRNAGKFVGLQWSWMKMNDSFGHSFTQICGVSQPINGLVISIHFPMLKNNKFFSLTTALSSPHFRFFESVGTSRRSKSPFCSAIEFSFWIINYFMHSHFSDSFWAELQISSLIYRSARQNPNTHKKGGKLLNSSHRCRSASILALWSFYYTSTLCLLNAEKINQIEIFCCISQAIKWCLER